MYLYVETNHPSNQAKNLNMDLAEYKYHCAICGKYFTRSQDLEAQN